MGEEDLLIAMSETEGSRRLGPWDRRVTFDVDERGEPFAYRDNELLIENVRGLRIGELAALIGPLLGASYEARLFVCCTENDDFEGADHDQKTCRWIKFRPRVEIDVVAMVDTLVGAGIAAQLNYVFFATQHAYQAAARGQIEANGMNGDPAMLGNPGMLGNPAMLGNPGMLGNPAMLGNPGMLGNPAMLGNPGMLGNPAMLGNPGMLGNPAMLGPSGWWAAGSGCCCGTSIARGEPWRQKAPSFTSATPTDDPFVDRRDVGGSCRVVVLDTGRVLPGEPFGPPKGGKSPKKAFWFDYDFYDTNGDRTVDPVAGHGTFIAGIISRLAPGATITVRSVLSSFGDGDECVIAAAIHALADDGEGPGILNLSISGYTRQNQTPRRLAAAVRAIQDKGWVVVASAGNDASCRVTYPAALPRVISVGALGPGGPAWFSNYGTWVRACAPGVELVSQWFDFGSLVSVDDDVQLEVADRQVLDEVAVSTAALHPDLDVRLMRTVDSPASDAVGWAAWSGTSFASPVVVGMLARDVLLARRSTLIHMTEHALDDARAAALDALPELEAANTSLVAKDGDFAEDAKKAADFVSAVETTPLDLDRFVDVVAEAWKRAGSVRESSAKPPTTERKAAARAAMSAARAAQVYLDAAKAVEKAKQVGEPRLFLEDAVFRIIDDPHLFRLPGMGTVVNAHF